MFNFGNPLGARIIGLGWILVGILIIIFGNIGQFLLNNLHNFIIIAVIGLLIWRINKKDDI